MAKNVYAVFGLGRFGMTLARQLASLGEDVVTIDRNIDLVNEADEFSTSYSYDFTNIENLKSTGIGDIDTAIIASGENLEEAILLIINLKELNVPRIIAKAQNKKFGMALKKVGADEIVLPEMDMAYRLAIKLSSSNNLVELFNIGDGIIAYEMKVKDSWVGKNLIELDLRGKYSINVVGVKYNGKFNVSPDPKRPFEKDDNLLILSDENTLKKLDKIK